MTPDLPTLIAQQIAAQPQQRLTFAEYMDLALYHSQHGYYSTQAVNIGSKGDFFTAPHLGADFGELLAEQFVEMWRVLGQPVPFTLVEMGAGQGILARDILRYLQQHYPDLFQALTYRIVEKSSALQAQQHQLLQGFPVQWGLACVPIAIVFSNELVDAFPVHQVVVANGQLQEVYVATVASGKVSVSDDASPQFTEILGDLSTPKITEYFELNEINLLDGTYPEGYRTEVNLAALEWLSTVATQLQRGYLLTIDYGYPAHRYYNPMRRGGTLQCYYNHAHHSNPYINIGRQDLTAHVNFTALERWGDRYGLAKVGFTQQGLFLMALGLGDRLSAFATSETPATGQDIQQVMQRRETLHQLIDPRGLGNFGVLIQGKGLTSAELASPLQGLQF